MKDYYNLSDEALIDMYHQGEKDAGEILCKKYKELVRQKAGSLYVLGAEKQDLVQEGMIGLFAAIRDFETSKNTLFSTFAGMCIQRQMYKAIESSRRNKAMVLNNCISLEEEMEKNGDIWQIVLNSGFQDNPEDIVLLKEEKEYLLDRLRNSLSYFEFQVLQLFMSGRNYTEIARLLGRDEKSIDNAIQRIKTKIKK